MPSQTQQGAIRHYLALTAFAAVIALLAATPRLAADWVSIGRAQTRNVSGLAPVPGPGEPRFLVVHDNKLPNEERLALVTLGSSQRYTPVPWPAGYALPIDLEAISAIPGSPRLYLTATSAGSISLLELTGDRVTLRAAATLPSRPGLPNFEGLSVQRIGTALVVAWGHRGAGPEAGRLYWGVLDLETLAVREVAIADVRVPFPSARNPNTRHISDLRVARDGRVLITSASDPGDDGPYASAMYDVGTLAAAGGRVVLRRTSTLMPLHRVNRKLEALELTANDTQIVFGTDDEHGGGALLQVPR